MADTLLTPDVGGLTLTGSEPTRGPVLLPTTGSLTLIGRRPPPALPVHQLNGTEAVDGVVLPVYQLNGTDTIDGAGPLTYQLNGTDVVDGAPLPVFSMPGGSPEFAPGTGSLVFSGYAPTLLLSEIITSTGGLTLSGFAPGITNSQSPSIVPSTGAVSFAGVAPSVTATYPDVSGSASINLLLHTISADGENDERVASTDQELPLHTLEASGISGGYISASIDLLQYTLEAGGNHSAEIELLLHMSEADGMQGGYATADNALLVHTTSATGSADNSGSAGIQLLTHTSITDGWLGTAGTLDAEFVTHSISAEAFAGSVGTADVTLFLYDLDALGFQPGIGTAEIELFAHSLESAGYATLAETYRCWVLNTRTNGLTEYTNFNFNSFAVLDGVVLAAGPSGIHVVGTQNLDDAAVINARVRTGAVDFESSMLKRVPRMYATGEFQDDVYFRTVVERDGERTYVLHSNGDTGLQQRRVPIGKGPKSVFWQFEVENIDGGDFRLQKLLAYPQELRRRVQ